MLARIAAPHVDPLLVPLHPGSNARSTEPQGQSAPSARREVRFGSMEQQIAVDRDLSGLEHIVDDLAVLLGVVDRLVQHVVFGTVAFAVGHVSEMMGTRDELHAGVFVVGIVDGKPHGGGFGGRQRPVAGVLVPSDHFSIVRHFAKEVRAPSDDVLAQKIRDIIDDSAVGEDIVDRPVLEVGRRDRVAVATLGHNLLKQFVKVLADRLDLARGVDVQRSDESLGVVVIDLLAR